VATDFALLWRGRDPSPNPELLEEYGEAAAPSPGERGFRAERKLPAGALDGHSPPKLAARLLRNATSLLDDPFLAEMLDPAWVEEWSGHTEVGESSWEPGELADLLGVPLRDNRGAPVGELSRSDYAHRVLELAADVRDGGPPGRRYGARTPHKRAKDQRARSRYLQDGWSLPMWAAEAVLADELAGRSKSRLVNVDKRTAYDFVKRHHSKLGEGHKLPGGTMFALGVLKGERLVAVGLAGHSPAKWSHDPSRWRTDPRNILELTRIASDGTTYGASSLLASRMIDLLPLAKKRGDPDQPSLFVTFSMAGEAGATYKGLREKGLRPVAVVGGKEPSGTRKGGTSSRILKIRWEAGEAALPPKWELLERAEPPKGEILPFLKWKGYRGGYRAKSPWGGAYVLVKGRKSGRVRWSAYREEEDGSRSFLGRAGTRAEAKGLIARRTTLSSPP